jgi:hypothetical protein
MERYVGIWHIHEMQAWDEEYFNMEVQAYIRIDPNRLGGFQFGLVTGQIDGEIVKDGASERFEFSWAGQDEMEPMSGCGWLRLKGKDRIEGRIKLHLGDSSAFSAKRAQ